MFLAIQTFLSASVVPKQEKKMFNMFVVQLHEASSEKFSISRVSFYRAKFVLSQVSLYREIPPITRAISLCRKIFYIKI